METKETKCLGKLGVFKKSGELEREILDLATEFKESLVDINWRQHRAELDFSYSLVPELLPALHEAHILNNRHKECDRQIKEENSKQRKKNAKTPLRDHLKELNKQRKDAWAKVKAYRKRFFEVKKAFFDAKAAFQPPAKDGLWKNVKDGQKRAEAYTALVASLEGDVKRYGDLWVCFDLERRALNDEYQKFGLHSDIRGEVAESVEPNKRKDKPGMRYKYGYPPDVEPVRKLTIQLKAKGKTFAELLDGKESQLRIIPRLNSKGKGVIYSVRQVIGNSDRPFVLEYQIKAHREIPADAIIKRWSLCCDDLGKRYVTPIILANHSKKKGEGYVTYDLGYRKRGDGLMVAYFLGDKIHEEVVLPGWLVNRFRKVYSMQSEMDLKANDFLSKRGIEPPSGPRKNPIKQIEKMALEVTDTAAQNFMDEYHLHERRRLKMWRSAIQARQNIYEHVVERVRRSHSHIIVDTIDMQNLVKRQDAEGRQKDTPQIVEQNRQIASVGSLSALLKGSGLKIIELEVKHSSGTCPHCGHVQDTTPTEVQTCAECQEKWHRDYGACVEMLSRADVPRQKAIHSRKTVCISTYVDSLAVAGQSPRAYKEDHSQDGEYGRSA